MGKEIYLDNSATTRIYEEALKRYVDVSREVYGNPSSLHRMGYLAERELKAARETILSTLGAGGSELIFTASGSEANNLAIFGRCYSKERYKRGAKIITTDGEHASVNAPLERLRAEGFRVVNIPTRNGKLDLDALLSELDGSTILVTMMLVNNETGAIYDTAAVARLIKRKAPEALLHVDATQGYLKTRISKASLGADMISISSHKIHGPKGVGALILDAKIAKLRAVAPMILGGGQEGGLRSGTENVPAAAAFAEAARIGYGALDTFIEKTGALREMLISELRGEGLSEISPTLPEIHAPHIINITLPGIKSETMLHHLSSLGIYVSSGSACSSNSRTKHSLALVAYGRSESEADSSIRISFSEENTEEDVLMLCEGLRTGLARLARIK